MALFDNIRSLSLLPPTEHLNARRTSKLEFLEQEKQQLEKYKVFLQHNLGMYKQLIGELLNQRSGPDADTTVSPRILQMLQSQNEELQQYLKQVTEERDKAITKEEESQRMSQAIQENEDSVHASHENKLKELVSQAEKKEHQVQNLEFENSKLKKHIEITRNTKEAVLTEKEKRDLLTRKQTLIKSMIKKIQHLNQSVNEDNIFLKRKLNQLDSHYDKVNAMLRDPEPKNYSLKDVELPRKNVTCDEFWMKPEESRLEVVISDSEEVDQILMPGKALENKLKKYQEQQYQFQVKVQAILHEISSARLLKQQLKFEKQNLQELVKKIAVQKEELDQQFQQQTSFSAQRSQVSTKPKQRCNSNPLDYADCHALFEHVRESNQLKTHQSDSSLDYDYEVDVSNIQDSHMQSELYTDSVLMDVFDISQNQGLDESIK